MENEKNLSRKGEEKVGAVMVVGGGVGGMQAALDLANSGFKVYLVEEGSAIGGRMAQLDKTFPTNDCSMCTISPKLVETGRHLNIQLMMDSEVARVEGQAGNFSVTVRHKPRYIDISKCTGCSECAQVCPILMPGRFDAPTAMIGVVGLLLTAGLLVRRVPGAILIGILGILIEVGGIRRLYGTEEFNPLLFTLGLNYVFVDIIRILFGLGGIGSSIPKGLTGMVNLGFMMFPKYRFFMILAGAAVVVLIWLFINRTNIGMVVRAGTKDNEMVQMLGINVRLVWTLIFGLGIALAALSGALIAPITGTIPEMGMFMVIEAFVVVVIGGMGSFAGSIVAGILVGEVIAITNLFYPQAGTVAIFILMAIILLTTKAGLFGEG